MRTLLKYVEFNGLKRYIYVYDLHNQIWWVFNTKIRREIVKKSAAVGSNREWAYTILRVIENISEKKIRKKNETYFALYNSQLSNVFTDICVFTFNVQIFTV